MSDDANCYAATPAATLEQRITDSNVAKSEAEWWAYHEITRLREELAAAQSRIMDLTKIATTLNVRTSKLNALREENAGLRKALKPFSKNYWSDDWHDGSDCEINVQLRDIRRAASLVDGYVWTPDE